MIEEIKAKADELGQFYFPDECNVWARDNIEAKFVSSACTEMAEWMQRKMVEKACEWLKKCFYEQGHEYDYGYYITLETTFDELNDVIDDFRKAMEE